MTTTEAIVATDAATSSTPPASQSGRTPNVQAVLEKLYELYPHLFGANFVPLKLGVFQELLANHPEQFERDSLKQALGIHTRSKRYLQCVAAGLKRHDLQGTAVEDVAPEHVYFALMELFRRKQLRSKEDLRPKLRARLLAAFDASGLTRQDYLTRVQTRDVQANTVLAEAFAERDQQLAKQEALRRAFQSSGKSVEEFADMYGMPLRDVTLVLGSIDPRPTTP